MEMSAMRTFTGESVDRLIVALEDSATDWHRVAKAGYNEYEPYEVAQLIKKYCAIRARLASGIAEFLDSNPPSNKMGAAYRVIAFVEDVLADPDTLLDLSGPA